MAIDNTSKPSITVTEALARVGRGIKRNGDLGQKRALPPLPL